MTETKDLFEPGFNPKKTAYNIITKLEEGEKLSFEKTKIHKAFERRKKREEDKNNNEQNNKNNKHNENNETKLFIKFLKKDIVLILKL